MEIPLMELNEIPGTELLYLELSNGVSDLTMRGKTISVKSRINTIFTNKAGVDVTLSAKNDSGSCCWPLPPKEAAEVWRVLFKDT